MLFNNLDQLYRSVIMDHYKKPRNRGELNGNHCVTVKMNNPSCGDKIQVSLEIENHKVKNVKYLGSGCAISQSSASMMTEAIKGLDVDQIHQLTFDFSEMVQGRAHNDDLDLGDAEALHGVSQYPARIKCATLAWKAVEKALRTADQDLNHE
ncbi:Fe-S cluster assembly sulfur transfer protein SufU [Sporolactobacillus terrae]|uniref:Iron-sulfur cluster assembly scaffold protein NifU n=1 Tax=Sporolactobacillus terrae TaxID=269673 RepID=A0A410D7J9_9BACL|nr:SUF system NifU family Fe-S cluster assembly protein [Sporolactobacillus terrae]QAA22090.1 SUF system NifU family Fe-S cluster assembly protein [Sporolactobacillus terrae]QAA25062.1 SUF system NifU family Fe-S cluster assembly protein [Sporolactobacillus terrae]UAK16885.1 SUF system NifU family Fe-S cluster assembly protein [Sporolactobacillus terrae]BBN98382.1 iron-sulfur cluster assembly scaffold protein NifU [Sporolactobacillus terrae]